MTQSPFLRRLWHVLPAMTRHAVFTAYLTFRELSLVPRDIWRMPRIALLDMDYESYWKTRGASAIQPRFRVIAGVVEEGASVLEIGCGDGLCMEFLEQTRKVRSRGFDVSEVSVKLARQRGLKAEVADVMSDEFRIESTYDYVLACELLEHLSTPERLVSSVRGAYSRALIVSVPNIAYFMHRLRLLFGRFPLQWSLHPGEHLRYWSIPDFRWWTQELGLRITRVLPANGLRLFNIHRLWPNLFANDVVYVLTVDDEAATKSAPRVTQGE